MTSHPCIQEMPLSFIFASQVFTRCKKNNLHPFQEASGILFMSNYFCEISEGHPGYMQLHKILFSLYVWYIVIYLFEIYFVNYKLKFFWCSTLVLFFISGNLASKVYIRWTTRTVCFFENIQKIFLSELFVSILLCCHTNPACLVGWYVLMWIVLWLQLPMLVLYSRKNSRSEESLSYLIRY